MTDMGFAAWEFALAGQILAKTGIHLDPDSLTTCFECGSIFRVRNTGRHYTSRTHRDNFRRLFQARSDSEVAS